MNRLQRRHKAHGTISWPRQRNELEQKFHSPFCGICSKCLSSQTPRRWSPPCGSVWPAQTPTQKRLTVKISVICVYFSCVCVCVCVSTGCLFYQLVVVLFDFNTDWDLWELSEQVLQQSKRPVGTTAVVTWWAEGTRQRLRAKWGHASYFFF